MTTGYRLANENCDVWLSNTRGTVYGQNHTTLNPFGSSKERKAFWSFSFHEMGILDLPVIIDYILAETKVSKLHFIGHSQGTSAFFVMASKRPEYNQKIEMMHALAPIAFVKHLVSPPLRALAPFVFSAKVRKNSCNFQHHPLFYFMFVFHLLVFKGNGKHSWHQLCDSNWSILYYIWRRIVPWQSIHTNCLQKFGIFNHGLYIRSA